MILKVLGSHFRALNRRVLARFMLYEFIPVAMWKVEKGTARLEVMIIIRTRRD